MRLGTALRLALSTLAKGAGDKFNPMHRFICDRIRSGTWLSSPLCVSSPGGYYSQDVGKVAFERQALSIPFARKRLYHVQKPIFGARGDFITAPEMTQLFGELVGVWVANELAHTGHQDEWQLVELGPGSGALMKDVLNTLERLKGQVGNYSVHLVETSDSLTSLQQRELASKTQQGTCIHWHKTLADVPEKFSVFIANEFFDALPIHQFQRDEQSGAWREVYVNLEDSVTDSPSSSSTSTSTATNRLCFMLSRGENLHTKGLILPSIRQDPTRTHWEICPLAGEYAGRMVQKFTRNGGFALIIDYGHDGGRKTPSLRAYRRHELVDPLGEPGEMDITTDVDFGLLKEALASDCLVFGPVNQRNFLGELGLSQRAEYLLRQCKNAEERNYIMESLKILVGGDEEGGMGTRFKAMSLFPTTITRIIDQRGGVPSGFQSSMRKSAAKID